TITDTEGYQLWIWQQNARKSWDMQMTTLHVMEQQYNIICLQEPHFDFQELTRATPAWNVVLPTSYRQVEQEEQEKDKVPRALTLVHERLSMNAWTQIEVDTNDVVAIQFTGGVGALNVYNIYNDCQHSETVENLERHFRGHQEGQVRRERREWEGDLWLGDFN
ncbi:hypothetical protein CPB84DRAFT_1690144, partial [Gymnopilus junonius]